MYSLFSVQVVKSLLCADCRRIEMLLTMNHCQWKFIVVCISFYFVYASSEMWRYNFCFRNTLRLHNFVFRLFLFLRIFFDAKEKKKSIFLTANDSDDDEYRVANEKCAH